MGLPNALLGSSPAPSSASRLPARCGSLRRLLGWAFTLTAHALTQPYRRSAVGENGGPIGQRCWCINGRATPHSNADAYVKLHRGWRLPLLVVRASLCIEVRNPGTYGEGANDEMNAVRSSAGVQLPAPHRLR